MRAIIWPLNFFFAEAWKGVALSGEPIPVADSRIQDEQHIVHVKVIPRKEGSSSLMTSTDLIEAALGVVYYMVQEGFFATTVTIVKPRAGRRVPVGEFHIIDRRPASIAGAGPRNSAVVDTA